MLTDWLQLVNIVSSFRVLVVPVCIVNRANWFQIVLGMLASARSHGKKHEQLQNGKRRGEMLPAAVGIINRANVSPE
jgi:hypothetical protein